MVNLRNGSNDIPKLRLIDANGDEMKTTPGGTPGGTPVVGTGPGQTGTFAAIKERNENMPEQTSWSPFGYSKYPSAENKQSFAIQHDMHFEE